VNRKELLTAALDAVEKRPKAYGPPEQNFERIAALWNIYQLDKYAVTDIYHDLNATDVAAMMVLMKVARIMETPGHTDSWVDLAGYAACGAEVSTAHENVNNADMSLAGKSDSLTNNDIFDAYGGRVDQLTNQWVRRGD
jgi:hypothetical protein